MMDTQNDSSSSRECFSSTEYKMLSQILNLTKAHEDSILFNRNGAEDTIKMAESLVNSSTMIIGAFTSIANGLGISPFNLFLSIAIMVFAFYKIIVPYNYVQDFDIPGLNYKRRDMVNIIRQMRKVGKKLPPPFPNGWYGVVESSELKAGQVKQVECFGSSIAVFRSQSGEAYAMDAHCPHLGANMAVGGVVKGDCLECPFHKWQFSGPSGKCVSIPGVDPVPKNAAVKIWDVREVDGMIFVWFHASGEGPTYELPVVEEVTSGKWKYMGRNDFIIPCHIQDIPENGADLAHLNALHQDHLTAGTTLPTNNAYNIFGRHVWKGNWSQSEDPHIALVELSHDIRLFGNMSMVNVDVTAKQIGPSYVLLEIRNKYGKLVILQTVTPLAPLAQRVIHRLYAPMVVKPIGNLIMWGETVMFQRDVMIWGSKEFVAQPLLVKTDKCLKGFRNWYKQFYSDESISFENALKKMQNGGNLDW